MDRSARHGPNRLLDYLTTHETVIRRFENSGMVEEDGLDFIPAADGRYVFSGYVLLRDRRLKVTVAKVLETVDASNPDDSRTTSRSSRTATGRRWARSSRRRTPGTWRISRASTTFCRLPETDRAGIVSSACRTAASRRGKSKALVSKIKNVVHRVYVMSRGLYDEAGVPFVIPMADVRLPDLKLPKEKKRHRAVLTDIELGIYMEYWHPLRDDPRSPSWRYGVVERQVLATYSRYLGGLRVSSDLHR